MQSKNFRTDINGLRAIAVIAVVFFHFNKNIVPGGFAGVDVFFVISGYLM
ncbi:acyltransferase family protein, partial [Proteus vulgaris]